MGYIAPVALANPETNQGIVDKIGYSLYPVIGATGNIGVWLLKELFSQVDYVRRSRAGNPVQGQPSFAP